MCRGCGAALEEVQKSRNIGVGRDFGSQLADRCTFRCRGRWLEDGECVTRGPESWHSAPPAAASPGLPCKERLPGRGAATELLRSQGSGMESAEVCPQSLRR